MIRIAICDDEKNYLDAAAELTAGYEDARGLKFHAEQFSNSSDLLDKIESGTVYDIYLLDIYLPGVTGMSVATELRSLGINSPVIFLTSSRDHALEAFGVNATHYLLKPYTKENFFLAMDKALESLSTNHKKSVVLKVNHEYLSVNAADICYCEAEDKYQRIYLAGGEKLLVRLTTSELYNTLEEFDCFCRCGRSIIINLNHISKVTAKTAVLTDGTEILVPHTAAAHLRSQFFEFFNREIK